MEKDLDVVFQVHNLEKHLLDMKSMEVHELVPEYSTVEDIDN